MTNIIDYYFLIEQLHAHKNYQENIVAFDSNLETLTLLRNKLNEEADPMTMSYIIRQGKNHEPIIPLPKGWKE